MERIIVGLMLLCSSVFANSADFPQENEVRRATFSPCRGKRLDSLSNTQFMTASQCVSMQGDCCGWDPATEYGSDDPRTMKPDARCYSCYNTKIVVKCTGKLIRTKKLPEDKWWVTAARCVAKSGTCCNGIKGTGHAAVFDPREHTTEVFCNNCYAGPLKKSSNGALSCAGKLLDTVTYTGSTCSYFGGKCCDNDAITDPTKGGTAWCPHAWPSRNCDSCFSGAPQVQA